MPPIIQMSAYEEVKNILLYGDSGIGKTVWTGDCDLILGVERGLVSAKRQGSKADLWLIESWGGTAQDTNAENNLRAAYAWLAAGGYKRYKWIGVDGITEMQELAKMHLIREGYEADPNQSEFVLEWQGNLELQQMTKIMVKNFCKLPANIVFTALPIDMEDPEGNTKVMPMVEGKKGAISQYTCAQMGAVGYMHQKVKRNPETKERIQHRRIYWEYHKPYFGKNRFGLPAYTEDKSLPEVVKMMDAAPRRPAVAPRRRRRVTSTTK